MARNPPKSFEPHPKFVVRQLREISGSIGEGPASRTWRVDSSIKVGLFDSGRTDIFWRALRGTTLVGAGYFFLLPGSINEGAQALDPSAQRRGVYASVVAAIRRRHPTSVLRSDTDHSPAMAAWWRKAGAIDCGRYLELPALGA